PGTLSHLVLCWNLELVTWNFKRCNYSFFNAFVLWFSCKVLTFRENLFQNRYTPGQTHYVQRIW
ncbi:hypothetical protein, partial [Sinomicrobium sp. M5D2P9]